MDDSLGGRSISNASMTESSTGVRSRRSTLQVPADTSGWIELFLDLVFVAVTLIFSSSFAAQHAGLAKVWLVVMFAMVWCIWLMTTLVFNRVRPSSLTVRAILLAQMFLVTLFAAEAHAGIDHDLSIMCVLYAGLLLTVGLLWGIVALRETAIDLRYSRGMAACAFSAAALFLICSPLADSWRYPLGLIALVIVVVPSLAPKSLSPTWPRLDLEHLVERLGAFSLIMMGETFIELAQALESHHANSVTGHDAIVLVFEFLFVFSLWAAYFEDIPHAGLRSTRSGLWLFLHLTMQVSIVLMGVGITAIALIPDGQHLPDQDAVEVFAMMAVFYFSLCGLDWCSERRSFGKLTLLRLGTASLIVVAGFISWFQPHLRLDDVVIPAAVLIILNALLAPRLIAKTTVVRAVPAPMADQNIEGS